jgi:chromate reductase
MAEAATNRLIHVAGFSGSLRLGSFNTGALRAAGELLPDGMSLEILEIKEIPLYNADVEQLGVPEPVQRFKERLSAADAVLIVTPEYNCSMPGVLKNAIDWVSRPPDPPLVGKPAALMGASPGALGTVRAQYHLRQVLVNLNVIPLNRPEIYIAQAHQKFDGEGRLTDEETRRRIRALLESLLAWTRRLVA